LYTKVKDTFTVQDLNVLQLTNQKFWTMRQSPAYSCPSNMTIVAIVKGNSHSSGAKLVVLMVLQYTSTRDYL